MSIAAVAKGARGGGRDEGWGKNSILLMEYVGETLQIELRLLLLSVSNSPGLLWP